MGKFTYETTTKVDFDDRILAHLQLVITTKLRRSEAFTFTWKDDASIGDGRTTGGLYIVPEPAEVHADEGMPELRAAPE